MNPSASYLADRKQIQGTVQKREWGKEVKLAQQQGLLLQVYFPLGDGRGLTDDLTRAD